MFSPLLRGDGVEIFNNQKTRQTSAPPEKQNTNDLPTLRPFWDIKSTRPRCGVETFGLRFFFRELKIFQSPTNWRIQLEKLY